MTTRSEESRDHRQAGTAPDDAGIDDPGVDDAETEAEAKAADRVVFFSDAVIAIAITLLALALPVPDLKGTATNGQYWHALTAERSDYLTFLISFAVIGNHWVTHRRVFRYVRRVDGHVGRLGAVSVAGRAGRPVCRPSPARWAPPRRTTMAPGRALAPRPSGASQL